MRNKIRRILSNDNADREDLFIEKGLAYLSKTSVLEAGRFVLDQLLLEWRSYTEQMKEADKYLSSGAEDAPAKEAEARAVLDTIPGAGRETCRRPLPGSRAYRRGSSRRRHRLGHSSTGPAAMCERPPRCA